MRLKYYISLQVCCPPIANSFKTIKGSYWFFISSQMGFFLNQFLQGVLIRSWQLLSQVISSKFSVLEGDSNYNSVQEMALLMVEDDWNWLWFFKTNCAKSLLHHHQNTCLAWSRLLSTQIDTYAHKSLKIPTRTRQLRKESNI